MNQSIGHLLERSFTEIWNERDSTRRLAAIERLYAPDFRFFESDAVFEGRAATQARIEELQGQWPAGSFFQFDGAARVNHNLVQLSWNLGPAGHPLIFGMDVAVVEQGMIKSLYLFLAPPAEEK
jgi:hypothetical protein